MIKLEFAQLAQKAILEKETNQLSLINIVHLFRTVGFPFIIPEIAFALRTSRDIEKDPQIIEMEVKIHQEEKVMLNKKIKIDYTDKGSNNTVIRIQGLVIEKPIPVEIICKRKDEEITKLIIPVEQISPAVEQQQAT